MRFWLMTIFFIAGCATPPHARRAHKTLTPKRREIAQEIKVVPAPKRPKITIKSLPDVIKAYEPEMTDMRNADDRKIASLKSSLSKYLPPQAKQLSLLADTDGKSAWFANMIIAVNPDGRAYFIDKKGKWFTEDLKDRVIGGTFVNAKGDTQLLTVFFSGLVTGQQYRAYLGVEPLQVIDVQLDHEHAGSMTAKFRTRTGDKLSVERPGRNNKAIRVNGRQMNALFL